MSAKDKLIVKFLKSPKSIRYEQLEIILSSFGFERVSTKGSHVKFKHPKLEENIVISVHGKDCKSSYKKIVCKILKENFNIL